jgi:hypothetical protein
VYFGNLFPFFLLIVIIIIILIQLTVRVKYKDRDEVGDYQHKGMGNQIFLLHAKKKCSNKSHIAGQLMTFSTTMDVTQGFPPFPHP